MFPKTSIAKSLIVLAALITLPATASAQPAATQVAAPMCGERGAVVGILKQQFGEEQEDAQLHSDQALIELFASERGTWSILLSQPNGTSCIVAAGKGLVLQARS